MLLNYLLAFGSLSTLSTAQLQIGAYTQPTEFSHVPTSFHRRSSNPDALKEGKLLRPFAFRRPVVIRRPVIAVAPNYNTAAVQVPVRPVRPVFVRVPLRPLRPIRPFALRPVVARPLVNSVQRPVYVGQSAAPVRPLRAPLRQPSPQLNSNSDRLPDIELRTQERRNLKREFQEVKKPLLKILNNGAKVVLQKVLQKASEPKDPSQRTGSSQLGFEEVINGAELLLRHYLELKSSKNDTEPVLRNRADKTGFPTVFESLLSKTGPESKLKSKAATITTSEPKTSAIKSQARMDSTSTSRAPTKGSKLPTVEPTSKVTSTKVPNLLSPWQSSNLLSLIKNSPLYNSIQNSVTKSSSQVNWKTANVSLVNAKIVNNTKEHRMGYIPSAWYSEDSDEFSGQPASKIPLTTLVTTTTKDPRAGGADASTENAASSSEETPTSAEETVTTATKSQQVDASSEEVSHHRLVVVGKGSAKPLLYSSSDEARSEEVHLWVLTTRKPTHSFGFGHSVVFNNHRAPSQNGAKRRRTTTTRTPTTGPAADSASEPSVFSSTTLPTSNSRFPLEVFDTDDFNTTIVHQNIITIAKPTRPFIVHPTQKFTTRRSPTTPRPIEEGTRGSKPSSEAPPSKWGDKSFVNNQVPEESRPTPFRLRPPSSTTPVPHSSSATTSKKHSNKFLSKRKPSKKTGTSQSNNSAIEISYPKPWTGNPAGQFANKPINQVPAILNPFGSVIQLFPNSLFRILQTIGGLVFALPTLLTFGFMALMLMV